MRKLVLLILIPLLFQGCNDGDIIVTNFDFEDAQLQQCGDTSNVVFFKICMQDTINNIIKV